MTKATSAAKVVAAVGLLLGCVATANAQSTCGANFAKDIGSTLTAPTYQSQTVAGDCTGVVGCGDYFDVLVHAGDPLHLSFCYGGAANFDATLHVHTGFGFTSLFDCNDDSCGSMPVLYLTAPSTQIYRVQVGAYGNHSGGTYNLEFYTAPSSTLCPAGGSDTDSDGVVDVCDNCPSLSNPDQKDTDNDGVGDACNDASDADGDEWADALDNCPAVANPGQENSCGFGAGDACQTDTDLDGIYDGCDNCPSVANPGQQRSCYASAAGDACMTDTDLDGIADACDNCPTVANPGQERSCYAGGSGGDACMTDTDLDGIADACDNCPAVANPGQEKPCYYSSTGSACMTDTDLDGISDDCDNCPSIANPDQKKSCYYYYTSLGDACLIDSDLDGVPDVCDNCPAVSNPGQEKTCYYGAAGNACMTDPDLDGVASACDNCPAVANADQKDTDNDGIGDACNNASDADGDEWADGYDNCPSVANPDQKDTDHSGIGDACNDAFDSDGDEWEDAFDNCPAVPNPDQKDLCAASPGGDACNPDTDGDGVDDTCDTCPGFNDLDLGNPCRKLFSVSRDDDLLRLLSKDHGSTIGQLPIVPAPGEGICPDDGATGLATNPLTGQLYALLRASGGKCSGDPTRTIFGGCPGNSGCHNYDNDQTSCEKAWIVGESGPTSCWYDSDHTSCNGCGPTNEGNLYCTNSCRTTTGCEADPTRVTFLGGPENNACHRYDDNQSACEKSYLRSGSGVVTSCWYDSDSASCNGCGPTNQSYGHCVNTCATCGDPARTHLIDGYNDCNIYNGNQAACESAYQLIFSNFGNGCGSYATCWYDSGAGACSACDSKNELAGTCANTCDPAFNDQIGHELVSIDHHTGVATNIGNTGDRFAGLAFSDTGTLYGITGDGACNPSTLFTLSTVDATPTKVTPLPGVASGEAIAFNTSNGLIYRSPGVDLETINPTSLLTTPIVVTGDVWTQTRGLTYDAISGQLLHTGRMSGFGDTLFSVSPTGTSVALGQLDHAAKGLAFAAGGVCGNGVVDAYEQCDEAGLEGGGGCCTPDCTFRVAGTSCGDSSSSTCDHPDTCNASGVCVPNREPITTVCRAAAGDCDVAEHCNGAGVCPGDSFKAAGEACGDAADTVCDNPDTCNGSGSCLTNREPITTLCRAAAGQCDVAENCDGAGSCPADAFKAADSACGDASDTPCDNPDTCDGSGVCKLNHEADGSPCDDSNVCTTDQCVLGSCQSTPISGCPVPTSGQATGDQFGSSVALSPNYLVVGAPSSPDNGSSGSAHVFVPSADGYTEIIQTPSLPAQLTATTPVPVPFHDFEHPTGNLEFGASVAVDGQTIVVGAPFDLVPVAGKQSSGSASVFFRIGSQWVRQAKLLDPSGLCTKLGTSVAISGDTVVVGAPGGDCVLVFQRTGSTWSAGARLDAGVTGVRFGNSVDVSGTAILVGAPGLAAVPGPGCSSQGAAYVFRRTGAAWALESTIDEPVDTGGDACFGVAVAIDGATGVIGAPADDSAAVNAGAAYVTEPTGAVWNLTAKLLAFPTQNAGDGFGAAVDIKSDLIIVGAPGIAAYLFHRIVDPSPLPRLIPTKSWGSDRRYTPPPGPTFGTNKFGFSVSVSSGTTAIGAPAEGTPELPDTGAVFPDKAAPELPPACGDGHTTAGEDCDDGDTGWTFGQRCSAQCRAQACGYPTEPGAIVGANLPAIRIADALFILRSAVGVAGVLCDLPVCDVNASGSITVADALLELRKAVGLTVALHCTPI